MCQYEGLDFSLMILFCESSAHCTLTRPISVPGSCLSNCERLACSLSEFQPSPKCNGFNLRTFDSVSVSTLAVQLCPLSEREGHADRWFLGNVCSLYRESVPCCLQNKRWDHVWDWWCSKKPPLIRAGVLLNERLFSWLVIQNRQTKQSLFVKVAVFLFPSLSYFALLDVFGHKEMINQPPVNVPRCVQKKSGPPPWTQTIPLVCPGYFCASWVLSTALSPVWQSVTLFTEPLNPADTAGGDSCREPDSR